MNFNFRNHLLVESQRKDQPATVVLHYHNDKTGTMVFTQKTGEHFIAVGFKGKATKYAFNNRFKTDEHRMSHVNAFIAEDKKRHAQKEAERAERKAFVPSCVVGDVLVGSYGWEQTNPHFYQVISIKNKTVVLRELKQDKQYSSSSSMAGKTYPLLNQFDGEEFKKIVQQGDRVKITEHLTVGLVKPIKFEGATPVYAGKSFSEYA